MVMYTFGQWIKIYRHLTMGGYPKKACPQQLLQTVNEHDKYTVIKITVICDHLLLYSLCYEDTFPYIVIIIRDKV